MNNTRVYIVFAFLTLLLGVGFYIWYNNYRQGRNINRLNIFGTAPASNVAAPGLTEKANLGTPTEKLFETVTEKFKFTLPKITI